jgi:ABC-type branched-subunit amino acid transport system substrate-binding protein
MREPRGRERPETQVGTLGRRQFLFGGLSVALPAKRAGSADLKIALLLPPGPRAPSILRGAKLGITEADSLAQMFGKKIDLALPSVPGPERLASVASRLVKEGVSVLVGGGDEPAAEALREVAREGKALFFNVGCASDRLRTERCDRHTFHLHASVQMHIGAAGFWLIEEKRLRRWAVLTEFDEVRRAVVALAEARGATVVDGAQAGSGTADWREALERLRAATPEALWIGLRAGNVPGFLQQYDQAGLAAELVGITPDAVGLPKLEGAAPSGVWPVMWHHTLEKYSARDLNGRYRRRFGERLDGASWSAWAALKLIGEAVLRAGTTPQALLEYLESDPPFDGHKGRPLTFRKSDHQLRQPMFLAQTRKADPAAGGSEVEVVAEVPRGDLDKIFLPPRDGGCL